MYLEKQTPKAIAAYFNISRQAVHQTLNSLGISKVRAPTRIYPFTPRNKGMTSVQRFWGRVDQSGGADACWPFVGASTGGSKNNADGYGRFVLRGRPEYAHHLAYYFHNKRRAKKWVLHHCDNSICVNPRHLYDGTPKDNSRDRDIRGRSGHFQPGWSAEKCAFTPSQVREIRAALANYQQGMCSTLARKYGVNRETIRRLKDGKSYRHVEVESFSL